MNRFLIVDDSPEDRSLLRSWIDETDYDHEIVEVDTVEAGLEAYAQKEFSCVLLDYSFPQSTAQDFLRAIKKTNDERLKSPVIVVTGQGNDEVAVRCIKAGAQDYINKDRLTEPGHVAAKIVRRVINEHEQIRELERSKAAEKKALLSALKSQEELERSISDLRRAKLSAEAANMSKSAFLANMSHEIRSPLTSILGFTQLLRENTPLTSEQNDYLRTIEKNGQHLLTVINEILDFSKVEAGKISMLTSEFNIHELIRELVDNFTRAAQAKCVTLRVFIHPDFPVTVISDATRLRQILTNLLSNSVKFTNRGEIAVIATIESSSKGVDCFSVVVSDSGDGINKTDAAKLFKRFAQANDSITARYGGTGLGLVLSKKLANLLGGDLLLISSEPGVGSLFKLTLPVKLDEKTEVPKKVVPTKFGGEVLNGLRVLVVDDSTDNQILLNRMLSKFGAEVHLLSDGLEAVDHAPRIGADVVLMDVQMPHLDGHEASKLLRRAGFLTPIIGLTAHALPEDRKKSHLAGFNNQLTKPIDSSALIGAILAVTQRRQKSDDSN